MAVTAHGVKVVTAVEAYAEAARVLRAISHEGGGSAEWVTAQTHLARTWLDLGRAITGD